MSYQDDVLTALREMRDELRGIRADIAARTIKKPKRRTARLDELRHVALETTAEQYQAKRVVELWGEICPDCPQPVELNAARRKTLVDFWKKMQGEDGVRQVFLTVAPNDWLCGRNVKDLRTGRNYKRSSGVGLFEAIRNLPEILEGTFR